MSRSTSITRRSFVASATLAMPHIARAQTKTPIVIANAAGNLNLVLNELLRQQGFLEQFGLAPEMLAVADGTKIMGGIIGGQIDCVMMSGFGQVYPAIEKGAKLKIIGGASLLPSLGIYTSKPDVKTLKDLEGRAVGTGSLGALIHQLMVAIMRKQGVDVSKVRFVNIGSSADIFRAAIMGTIDAGVGEMGVSGNIDMSRMRLIEHANLSEDLTEYTYQGAWASDRAIASKRDTIVRALAGYAKLYRFVQSPDGKDAFYKARKAILPNTTDIEQQAQWEYVQHYKPYAEDLIVNEERVRYMQQLNIDTQVQSKMLPYAQVADMSLARDAVALLK